MGISKAIGNELSMLDLIRIEVPSAALPASPQLPFHEYESRGVQVARFDGCLN